MLQNHLKYSQSCSPLLHYRFAYRANSCGNAITKPPAFSCSPLLHYRKAYRANSYGNAIANLLGSLHTGKERDSETGFSYFGARYYDSDLMTGWLSVDPMADKYPNISPYAYCAWNPIRLVDPDGREIVFEDNKVKVLFEQVYNNVKNRISKLENSGLKKKRDIREYEQLKEIYASLNDVKESSIVFYYKTIKNDGNTLAEGHTYGKKNVDGIIVEILEGSENTLIHETRHASGYINEEWDLNKNVIDSYGVYTPTNYDYQDEYEGYNQAYIYSRIFHNELYKSDNQIKNEVIHFNCYKDYIIKEFVQYSKSNPYKK